MERKEEVIKEEKEDLKIPESISILYDGWDRDSLVESIYKLYEVKEVYEQISELKTILEKDIMSLLKESQWDQYLDDNSKLKVVIKKTKKQTIDKVKLKTMLTQSEISKIVTTIEDERIELITPLILQRLKENVSTKK